MEDLNEADDMNSLLVQLYSNNIPPERETEFFSDRSFAKVYAVAVSAHECTEGTYFLSIKCQRNDVRYRVLTLEVQARLDGKHKMHGEVCPNNWVSVCMRHTCAC